MSRATSTALVTAWSYSRWADYEQCPLYFKLKHLDKIKPPGSAAMDRGSDIHKEGENYLNAPKKPRKVPANYAHFAEQLEELYALKPMVEQQWGFTQEWTPATGRGGDVNGWFAKDTWLRIVCDVAVEYDDHDYDIIDFKTGRKYDTNEHQVELFSCAPFMRNPATQKVTTRLWYLDQPVDNEVIREYTRKDFEAIRRDWTKRIQPMFNDRRFSPKPNQKCRWCHFRKDNGGPCRF